MRALRTMRRSNEAKTVLGDFLSFVQMARTYGPGRCVGQRRLCTRGSQAHRERAAYLDPDNNGLYRILDSQQAQRHNAPFAPLVALSHPECPMYVPAHFEENRPEVLHQLIVDQPFGTLVTTGPNGLDANHLPFELAPAEGPHGTLRAHVARANPVWQEVASQPDTLVIFQGPAAYISPNWYPSKHEAHRQVPTYNYMVVHAHGRVTVRDDEAFVRGGVARLTKKMGAGG